MILSGLTITAFFLTIVFGIQYRMIKQPIARKVGQSIMNIFMGIALILFAVNQFLFPELSTMRLVIGGLLMLLGLINLIMGIKNYRLYKRQA